MPLHVSVVSWILEVPAFPVSTILLMSATFPFLSWMLPACAFSHSSLSRPSNFLRRKLRTVAQLCCTESRSGITDSWTPGRRVTWKWPGLHFFSISSSCTLSFFSRTYFFHTVDSVFIFCKINLHNIVQLLTRFWTFGEVSLKISPKLYSWFLLGYNDWCSGSEQKYQREKLVTNGLPSISLELNTLDLSEDHWWVPQFNRIVYCMEKWPFSFI